MSGVRLRPGDTFSSIETGTMKTIKIEKNTWAAGIEELKKSYQLIGPAGDGEYSNFKSLEEGQLPDLRFLNTRMSAKSLVQPQSQTMFTYSLDESEADHHILKPIAMEDAPRAVIGIR